MFKRSARIATLAVAATALTAAAGAPAASASDNHQAKKAPCRPSIFHTTMYRYKNVRKTGALLKVMPRSGYLHNASPNAMASLSVTYAKESTWTAQTSA